MVDRFCERKITALSIPGAGTERKRYIGHMRWPILSILLVTVLFMSCSSNQDVVGRGPFQARKYRPGWNVELRSPFGRKHDGPLRTSTTPDRMQPLLAAVAHGPSIPPAQPRVAEVPVITRKNEVLPTEQVMAHRADVTTRYAVSHTSHDQDPTTDTEHAPSTRKWNTLSLVAAGGVALAFIALFIGGGAALWSYLLGASLILAVIGLVQAIQRDERGKGIAIAAIVLPILFLALVIAALNAAW